MDYKTLYYAAEYTVLFIIFFLVIKNIFGKDLTTSSAFLIAVGLVAIVLIARMTFANMCYGDNTVRDRVEMRKMENFEKTELGPTSAIVTNMPVNTICKSNNGGCGIKIGDKDKDPNSSTIGMPAT